jgi:nitrite reductase/ring-hydroxylating ferredoxin subunit
MTVITFLLDLIRRYRFTFSNEVSHVATYTRELPVSIERMYENAIDGEHLPHLHSDSFSEINIIKSGSWGWLATGYLTPKSFMNYMKLELKLDRENHRWITRTLAGLGKGTEIWTHAIPLEDHKIKIIVDFYVPKLPGFLKGMYEEEYIETYAKLYDQDLWMMATRQNELDRLKKLKIQNNSTDKSTATVNNYQKTLMLGDVTEIERTLPYEFTQNGHPYRLIKLNNELVAHSSTCPHMLGPLQKSNVVDGTVKCPWHGYTFDVKTRECTAGKKCKLAPAPVVSIENGNMVVTSF